MGRVGLYLKLYKVIGLYTYLPTHGETKLSVVCKPVHMVGEFSIIWYMPYHKNRRKAVSEYKSWFKCPENRLYSLCVCVWGGVSCLHLIFQLVCGI